VVEESDEFGYTVANDISARDIQFGDGQWVRGKSLDTFCPLGPVIVTADEIPDPQAQQTFERSKLDWNERERGAHREIFEWYRQLIRLRRGARDFQNGLLDPDAVSFDEAARWITVNRGPSAVICNFAPTPQRIPIAHDANRLRVALASRPGVRVDGTEIEMPPVSVAVLLAKERGTMAGALT